MKKKNVNYMKYILMMILSGAMAFFMWGSIGDFKAELSEGLREKLGFPVSTGMLVMMYLALLVLCIMVIQNLFQVYLELRYKDEIFMTVKGQKLWYISNVSKLVSSAALRLVCCLVFVMLAAMAFFSPGVSQRGASVYVAGVFVLVLGLFIGFMTVKVTRVQLKAIRRVKNYEAEEVSEEE